MLLLLACQQASQEFIFTDDNNYSFSSSLQAASTPIAEGQDANLDWSQIQIDMLGNALDPAEIDALSIIRFPRLSQEEVLLGINNETLKQSDLSGFVDYSPQGDVEANLTEFTLQGTAVTPETDLMAEQGTFLVLAEREERVLSLLFFEPNPQSDNHSIQFVDDSVVLSYEVSLQGSTPLSRTEAREYYFDWSEITETGTGTPISLPQIDRLLLGGFSLSLDDLEGDFLRIEQLADILYTADVLGETAIPLSRIDGFAGFDENLQWVVALQCSRCMNPAPYFVGVFE